LDLRHRTLAGNTVYYHTYFEPKGLDKSGRRYAIDSFKHPATKEDKVTSEYMIDYALEEFYKKHNLNEFDIILGLPSSSRVVSKTIDRIKARGFAGTVVYKGFTKSRMRNTYLRQELVDREKSVKTKEKVPKSFNDSRRLHYDKVSKSSLFPTRFRRYVAGLLNLYIDPLTLVDKKVLLVDDTFGEGLTLCDACDTLKPYTKNVIAFTVMKDMSQKR
jgi:hypothetical protein